MNSATSRAIALDMAGHTTPRGSMASMAGATLVGFTLFTAIRLIGRGQPVE